MTWLSENEQEGKHGRGGEGRCGEVEWERTGKSQPGDACQRAWVRKRKKNRKFCFSLLFCTWLSLLPRVIAIRDRGRQWWRLAGLRSPRCHCWLWASHGLLWVYLIQINKLLSAHWNKLGFGIVKLHCGERQRQTERDRQREREKEREIEKKYLPAGTSWCWVQWRQWTLAVIRVEKARHSSKAVAQRAAGRLSHWLSQKQQLCWCWQHSHTVSHSPFKHFMDLYWKHW